MSILAIIIDELAEKPFVGVSAGLSSGVIASVNAASVHQTIFQVLGNVGIVLGVIIAIMTLIIRAHEMKNHFFKPKIKAEPVNVSS